MAVFNSAGLIAAMKSGASFFRFTKTAQQFTTETDIIQVDTGVTGIGVGPNSHVGNFQIDYLDPNTGNDSSIVLTPQAPVEFRIDALMNANYGPTSNYPGAAGRINISVSDTGFKNASWTQVDNIFIDLLFFFRPVTTLLKRRFPVIFKNTQTLTTSEVTVATIPYWNRKKLTLYLKNTGTTNAVNWRITGQDFDGTGAALGEHQIFPTSSGTSSIAAGATASYVLESAFYAQINLFAASAASTTSIKFYIIAED